MQHTRKRLRESPLSALTPNGVAEGSRWSQRSEDHRTADKSESHPGGVPAARDSSRLAPLQGASLFGDVFRGYRYRSIPGYRL